MRLMVDIPVLPASAGVEEIAAGDEVGVAIAKRYVKAFAMPVELAVLALPGQHTHVREATGRREQPTGISDREHVAGHSDLCFGHWRQR